MLSGKKNILRKKHRTLMKFSEISLPEKINDARNLIYEYSKSIIADIDKILKERKPHSDEAPYYDLIAESFFSIQSFCLLVKRGLISSACAILRIILEQVSISYLLSTNPDAKTRFLQIKKDMIPYLVADKEDKNKEEFQIRQKYSLSDKLNIHNFFDYGFCVTLGCKSMNLKSICEKADTSKIYDMTTEFLHGFAHGQTSIHQFYRRRNGVDRIFINDLHLDLFQLFYKLLETVTTEFGECVVSKENNERFNMIECLVFDIRTRLAEDIFYQSISKNDLSEFNVNDLNKIFVATSHLLNFHEDQREKYLLSQSYMRLAKLIIANALIKSSDELLVEKSKVLSMTELFKKYKPLEIKEEYLIDFNRLLEMMDVVNDDWSFNDDDIDYNVAYSINNLIGTLLDKYGYE